MKGVYRFDWDWGDYGQIFGIFIADSEDVAAADGKVADFRGVAWKDSPIEDDLTAEDFELISADPAVVSMVESLGLTIGYNPLDYLKEPEE